MAWYAVIKEPNGTIREEKLINFPVILGRDRSCGVIINDSQASRQHVKLVDAGDSILFSDMDSANGTVFKGAKAKSGTVQSGDAIEIGQTSIEIKRVADAVAITDDTGKRKLEILNSMKTRAYGKGGVDALLKRLSGSQIGSSSLEKRVNIFAHLSMLLAEAEKLEDFLQDVLDSLLDTLSLAGAAVVLKDASTGSMNPIVAKKVSGMDFSVSTTIYQHVVTTGESIITDNAAFDARFQEGKSVVASRIRSVICVPISVKGKIIGALYVGTQESATKLGTPDLEFVGQLGSLAATAIRLTRPELI